jgi:general stress protein 26
MVCGDFELVSDPGVKRELWQPEWTMYYPGGPDDADYAVMALKPVFVKLYHQMETFSMEAGAAK